MADRSPTQSPEPSAALAPELAPKAEMMARRLANLASEQTIPERGAAAESCRCAAEKWTDGGLSHGDQPNDRKSKGECKTVSEAFDSNCFPAIAAKKSSNLRHRKACQDRADQEADAVEL